MANRLAGERSPYLLQHAHNPVDWYPWGEEAFALARREEKPLFLSVGYSACHWCHVMERESFEDAAVAALLAERFVCVKVDREERPDVDQVYQLAYQAFAQRAGGWPLSAFLTPEREPFFLATYLPPERRYGMPSFREVVLALSDAWKGRREEVLSQARELRSVLERHLSAPSESAPRAPRASELARMTLLLLRRADAQHGGFGKAPKFPNTLGLELLACARACEDHEAAGQHFLRTLDAMARGGMRDHLGGGFARYSTDERWLVPHFEKMLYDNALLLRAYTEGHRLAGEQGEGARAASYESVARSLVGYLEREMLEPTRGVFYSAQDADSEGEEGRFFVWTPAELEATLPAALARVALAAWDVRPEGNFEHGRSVLWTPREDAAVAAELGLSVEDLRAQREAAREALFLAREARPRPALDDKSLAGWNALLLASLADAGAVFEEPRWVELSLRALRAWLAWRSPEGALPHASKKGEPYGYGFLDDYAGLCVAATELLYARPEGWLLEAARSLLDAALARFWDEERGVLYATPSDGEVVLVRPVETHDHAWPCGAGLCADALLRLHTLTGEARYREVAERLLHSLTEEVSSNPLGAGSLARALDRLARGELTVVLTGPASPEALALEREARAALLPHRTLLRVTDEAHGRSLGVDPSLYEGRCTEAPAAWVCRGSECLLPARDPATLRAQLRSARRG